MSQRVPKDHYWQDAPMPRHQLVLFAETLESRLPEDHPVRLVDEILDQLDWTDWEANYHGSFGQPPIHPSVMSKILLFAILRGIRSSRKIEYELKHAIDFIWLAAGRTIDHSTLSAFRRDHQGKLKKLYRDMVKLAIDLKVAKLSELCIDGSRVLANANRYKTLTAKKAQQLIEQLDEQIETAMEQIDSNDELDELFDTGHSAEKLPQSLADLKSRQQQLKEALAKLQEMDDQRSSWVKDRDKNPAQLPVTDPDARILPNKEGGYAANYTPMVTTDAGSGVIVEADVVVGNVEHDELPMIVDRVENQYGKKAETVMADSAYTTGENLTSMEEKQVEMLGPLAEPKSENNPADREDLTQPVAEDKLDQLPINPQTKRFDKSAFVYEEASDSYYCPAGKVLPRSGTETKTRRGKRFRQMVYTCQQCAGCPLAQRCRQDPSVKRGRRVSHDIHEGARRRHRERMNRANNRERYKVRQYRAETPFAVLKACFDLRRFLLRGLEGVQREWLWHCTAFNLKKLMRLWEGLRDQLPQRTEAAVN